ncbi:speckle-type poz protein [Anaeramoeba ignava]|uniref:Speckle-type poz protein n=1 Tax=Anaeramoeba ignava TaxID=1746090 RepID=A0A9Q0R886_ANAIG|nr:speckle-type poz protein [Anaeramoeba ignava]
MSDFVPPIFLSIIKKPPNLQIIKDLCSNPQNLQIENLSPLHWAIFHQVDFEIIKIICESGFDLNNFKTSVFEYSLINYPSIQILKILIENGAYFPKNINLFVYCVENSQNFEVFQYICELGGNINIVGLNSVLHSICIFGCDISFAKTALKYGADPKMINGFEPIHYAKDQEMKDLLLNYHTLVDDLLSFLHQQQVNDLIIKTKDKEITANKTILKARITEEEMTKLLHFFKNINSQEVMHYLEIIYGGILPKKENFEFMHEFERIFPNFRKNLLFRKNVVLDIQRLFYDEESKDFEIIFGSTSIKAHKAILAARSALFQHMFISVNDNSNSVHDYTQKDPQIFQYFLKFLYFDDIDSDLPQKFIEDLEDCIDFYQLHPNCLLTEKLNEIKIEK